MSHAAYHANQPTESGISTAIRHARSTLLEPRARLLRFACVGGLATLTQLVMLSLFTAARWEPIRANALALTLSSQVNFGLSSILTWGDTWDAARRKALQSRWGYLRLVGSRWTRFMGAILCTTALNEGLYTIAQRVLAPLVAALLCSVCVAALNFVIGDRLIFTRSRSNTTKAEEALP